MPFGIVLLLINVGLIVHAAKTGRFWPWGYIILFIPGLGALAYVLVEMAPEWFGSVQGQKARRHVVNTLDPSKRYRALTEQFDVTDTIANRAALAEELRRSTSIKRWRTITRAPKRGCVTACCSTRPAGRTRRRRSSTRF
jgi:hypothetical protein